MTLGVLLRENREEILSNWEGIVRALPGARHLSHPRLRDHMPVVLGWLVDRLAGGDAVFPHEQSLEHATARAAEGYDLSEVITEYAVLRDCLLELWERAAEDPRNQISPHEVRILNQALDDAITYSSVFYARARLFRDHEQLRPPPSPH